MEKVEFFQGFTIILVCVLALVLIRYSKLKSECDNWKTNSRVNEDLINYYKQTAGDYKYLYSECKDTVKVLDGQVKLLNNEVAKYHGRKDSGSYYSDVK